MEIVRSGVGVNYREPPDKIGRVGISDEGIMFCAQYLSILISNYMNLHETLINISSTNLTERQAVSWVGKTCG